MPLDTRSSQECIMFLYVHNNLGKGTGPSVATVQSYLLGANLYLHIPSLIRSLHTVNGVIYSSFISV